MRRPLPLGLSPRSGRTLAPGRLLRAALRAPNIPLTAAPHGVGCEVTRDDPGGGGEALSRRSSGRSSRFSIVYLAAPLPPCAKPRGSGRPSRVAERAGRTPNPAAGWRTSPAPRFWAQAPPAGPSGASW